MDKPIRKTKPTLKDRIQPTTVEEVIRKYDLENNDVYDYLDNKVDEVNSVMDIVENKGVAFGGLYDDIIGGSLQSESTLTGWNKVETLPTNADSQDGMIAKLNTSKDLTPYIHNGDRVKYKQAQNLTAYWTFDTNSNSQIGSFNGTDTSVSYSTDGKFSKCATFSRDSSSRISLTDNSVFHATTFTIGFWFKSNTKTNYQAMFLSGAGSSNYCGITIQTNTSGQPYLVLGNDTGSRQNVNWHLLNGITDICDNNWHFVVITFNGTCFGTDRGYAQIYVDGNLDAEMEMFVPVFSRYK